MTKRCMIVVLALGGALASTPSGWAQGLAAVGGPAGISAEGFDPGSVGEGATYGGLGTGTGGGQAMPGAVLVKITGEVQCLSCTLEKMGVEHSPGSLYQFSHDNTHMVIKVNTATPDFTWQMLETHKLFLAPGEEPEQLQHLLNASQAGQQLEVTGGVAPGVGGFIPLRVQVK